MKKVIALEMGIYRDSRRRKGTIFQVEDDEEASWYKPLESVKKEEAEEPLATLSEISRGKRARANDKSVI